MYIIMMRQKGSYPEEVRSFYNRHNAEIYLKELECFNTSGIEYWIFKQ